MWNLDNALAKPTLETTLIICISQCLETFEQCEGPWNFLCQSSQDPQASITNKYDEIKTFFTSVQNLQWSHTEQWLDQQNFNNRLYCVQINGYSNLRIGKNIIMNRLGILNNEIDFRWLNLSFECFKIKCKGLFMTWSYRHKYIESNKTANFKH